MSSAPNRRTGSEVSKQPDDMLAIFRPKGLAARPKRQRKISLATFPKRPCSEAMYMCKATCCPNRIREEHALVASARETEISGVINFHCLKAC